MLLFLMFICYLLLFLIRELYRIILSKMLLVIKLNVESILTGNIFQIWEKVWSNLIEGFCPCSLRTKRIITLGLIIKDNHSNFYMIATLQVFPFSLINFMSIIIFLLWLLSIWITLNNSSIAYNFSHIYTQIPNPNYIH